MAGIYIHIPFCKKSCFYCDFHFSVNKKNIDEMVGALKKEIEYFGINQFSFFDKNEIIDTIYFGGGTPSVLSNFQLSILLDSIIKNYKVNSNLEITIETNPDNLDFEYCKNLKKSGFNRLSIGIQSFFDNHLKWMNRSHTAKSALQSITNASNAGFKNINIDLIYGFPLLSDKEWEQNLKTLSNFEINHLSSYSLTVEANTPLRKLIDTGKYKMPIEENQVSHFKILQNWAKLNHWEQYEISNFCKNGNYSRHNCSYWQNVKFLGIGPSAHSFNLNERRWNIANNKLYIENLNKNEPLFTKETLCIREKYNDYILTSLRTIWGISIAKASEILGKNFVEQNNKTLAKYSDSGMINTDNTVIKLSPYGMLYADKIASDLFLI